MGGRLNTAALIFYYQKLFKKLKKVVYSMQIMISDYPCKGKIRYERLET